VSHANAHLTPFGRLLLARRIVEEGRPVPVRGQGPAWPTSRPHAGRHAPPAETGQRVLAARDKLRAGRDVIAARTRVPARTVTRILTPHGVPMPADRDPVTGLPIRATRTTATSVTVPAT
jgi:hypothetical protein